MYKIIGADGSEYGPVSADLVRQWIAEGRLNGVSKIQAEGSGEWKLLRDLPEFTTHLPPAPPPISLPPSSPAAPARTARTNPLAGWSLGLGIGSITCCCFTVLMPVASIVLGAMALSQIKQNPNQRGKEMAVAGIILGSIALLMGVVWWIISLTTGFADPSQFPRGFPFSR